jgi:hypothetical protein
VIYLAVDMLRRRRTVAAAPSLVQG